MNYKVKALCAAAVLALPGASYAADEAMAVALSAAMQPVYVVGEYPITVTGEVEIPALEVDGHTVLGPWQILPLDGETVPDTVQVTSTGMLHLNEYDGNRLSSISVAAAAGRTAAASAAANNNGSTAANSGATMIWDATVNASSHSWGGEAYTSRVNIR